MAQLPSSVGASSTLFQHQRPNSPNRSRFDLSRITNFTAEPGMIIPFDTIPTLPGDSFDINFEFILDTLPLVNPSLTSYKVLTHWYYIKNQDLWEGWKTFSTKGRSGNIKLSIPRVDLSVSYEGPEMDFVDYPDETTDAYQSWYQYQSHHSLSAFLGVPPYRSGNYHLLKDSDNNLNPVLQSDYLPYVNMPRSSSGSTVPTEVLHAFNQVVKTGFNQYKYPSALPFMAYQNICKYEYVPQNLLQDNHSLFPEKGDHDWFLKYNASITNFVDFDSNDEYDSSVHKFSFDGIYSKNDNVTSLLQLRYACFDDDYFTTGLPWLERGSVDPLETTMDFSQIGELEKTLTTDTLIHIQNSDFLDSSYNVGLNGFLGGAYPLGAKFTPHPTVVEYPNSPDQAEANAIARFRTLLGKIHVHLPQRATVGTSITANQLRELIALSVWHERNARVNGSYNALIYQHWRVNPHGEEHKPTYIGGTADYVAFSTILQSSQSTDDSPLGSTAGRGSAGGSQYVGRFDCDDAGFIMGIMIIKPNTTYMQGVEHFLSCENTFDDFPQPEFEGLSPQPILVKELYVDEDSSVNEDLFAYQERYVYYKARLNVNRGMFQCKPDKDRLFGSFTQARWFEERPELSYQLLAISPDNVRRDWLAYPSLPTFKIQAASKVFVTRELSYTSQPNTFGF